MLTTLVLVDPRGVDRPDMLSDASSQMELGDDRSLTSISFCSWGYLNMATVPLARWMAVLKIRSAQSGIITMTSCRAAKGMAEAGRSCGDIVQVGPQHARSGGLETRARQRAEGVEPGALDGALDTSNTS